MSVPTSESVTGSQENSAPLATTPAKKLPLPLIIAGVSALVWLAFLLILTWKTANPATLNVQQLLHSDTIVLVKIIEPEQGIVEIEEVLLTRLPDLVKNSEQIRISQKMTHWKIGDQRLLPIRRQQDGSWGITPSPIKQRPILDYPADSAVLTQFEQLEPTLTKN